MDTTETINQHIQDIISQLNFKDSNSINLNAVAESIKVLTGNMPSIVPKWEKKETANEDMLLDGSNKVLEKITKLKIVYLDATGLPVSLEYYV